MTRHGFLRDMRLTRKFNSVLLLVFSVGFALSAYFSKAFLEASARDEVMQDARLIMASMSVSRDYTAKHVAPLAKRLGDSEFFAESVPAFGATEQFNTMQKKFPDFAYKEAALNPTNPRDRASDWEADVIGTFRQYPERGELVGERATPTGTALYLGKPITIRDGACLTCHSTPSAAPPAMLAKYGSANGFGWKLDETIGAQIVSVPMTVPLARAHAALVKCLTWLAVVFALVFVALNVLLSATVVRPVTELAALADRVSLGKLDGPDFPATGRDEVSLLAASFNRMKTSVIHALSLLDETTTEHRQ